MCEVEGSCTCTHPSSESCFSAPCNPSEWKASSSPTASPLVEYYVILKQYRRRTGPWAPNQCVSGTREVHWVRVCADRRTG